MLAPRSARRPRTEDGREALSAVAVVVAKHGRQLAPGRQARGI
ncbi:hypothetical protein QTO28_32815 [Streptomyces sp. P9-2B-1]|nr:hypothetical protein [Streptomyces sp. P9-2B-1]WJY29452.1 hypothetical protein QTO28_00010 [Streptomyces sp. P9-2B-1]WJY35519.1 hypothetical protein QTO28_32815 [Streptomyces sp. P9-2B-1]